ncbi:MAG: GTPase [Lacunisphaera sp.]
MKIKSAVFETSAPTLAAAPRLALPEFAFIGRSNVGKSSLLNLLAEKRDLARVSDLPGKTQLMNFYTINLNWRLVDLPAMATPTSPSRSARTSTRRPRTTSSIAKT